MIIVENHKKIKKLIKKADNIYLIGHKNLDLDAIGSQIGMLKIIEHFKKTATLIIDDKEHEAGVNKILKELDGVLDITTSSKVKKAIEKPVESNLLIIHDTNKKELLQNENILKLFNNIMIIDHHEMDKNSIKDAYIINDTETSSTCEMIAELISEYDIELDPYYATVLLSGITLDTNNFMLNTNPETFYMAYFLTSLGASAKKVQYLLKQDIESYIEREKLFSNITIINEKIAFTKGTPHSIYRQADLAKVADTLLLFNNIEASFVIGKTAKNEVGLSSRSLGNYDILNVITKLGGGGSEKGGAAKFTNMPLSKIEEMIKKIIAEED